MSFFQQALRNDRLAHAFCFYGPKESPKLEVAIELAKALNCEYGTDDACDQCRSCRQIQHGNHVDVLIIEPEGSLIKIDQLRALQRQFRLKTAVDNKRIVIIKGAEKMRAEAANSLLKFLEEPVAPMVAILLTEQIQAVLPTIRSRCQQIRFPARSPQLRATAWEQHDLSPQLASLLAYLDLDVADYHEWDESRWIGELELMINWNRQIIHGSGEALLIMETPQFRRILEHQAPLLLDLLLLWYRELILFSTEGEHHLFVNWSVQIKEQAFHMEYHHLLSHFDQIIQARSLLEHTFLQPKAIIEKLVLGLQESIPSLERNSYLKRQDLQ